MAKQRLINCDFLNASSHIDGLSNKAKLLYIYMFLNADDRGFVDNTTTLIKTFENNDKEFGESLNLSLLENDYISGLNSLIEKGLIYEFRDKHNNVVHLIRHWYFHNKFKKGLWTNYGRFLKLVEIVDGEYVLKESSKENNKLNEIKINENKLNEIKINNSNGDNSNNEDGTLVPTPSPTRARLLKELEEDDLEDMVEIIDDDPLTGDDYD